MCCIDRLKPQPKAAIDNLLFPVVPVLVGDLVLAGAKILYLSKSMRILVCPLYLILMRGLSELERVMKKTTNFILIAGALVAACAEAQAPTWSDEQTAVWTVVEQSWDAQVAENGRWPGDFTHEKFVEWADNLPAPRGKEKSIARQRLADEASNTVWHEITPLVITVVGDTAVVMYSALLIIENSDGDRNPVVLSVDEVLVRDGGSWEYLATSNFSPSFGN